MTPPILTTDRLVMRGPEPRDLDGFMAYFTSDRSIYTNGPLKPKDAWEAFAVELGHWQLRGFGMWALTRKGDDTCIGMVGGWYPLHWPEKEMGWLLWPEAEGHGYAFEAATAARAWLYDMWKWPTMVSYVDRNNARSMRLAERLGASVDPDATPVDDDAIVYRHPTPEACRRSA